MQNITFQRLSLRAGTIISAFCLLIAFLLMFSARYAAGFAQWYAVRIYPVLLVPAAKFFSVWNGSVSEALLVFIIVIIMLFMVFGIVAFLFRWRSGKRVLSVGLRIFLCLTAFLVLIYSLTCSINYQRYGIGADLNLPPKTASKDNLMKLGLILADEISGLTEDPGWDYSILSQSNENKMRSEAVTAMQRLGDTEPTLSGYYPEPKPVYYSDLLSKFGIEGIYSPITMEANYNQDMTPFLIPFAMCHELAHLKGYMKEDDAGFIAYLACIDSPSPVFRYSGLFRALTFVLNALKEEATAEEFNEIFARLPLQIRYQLTYVKEKNLIAESSSTAAAKAVNDLYLKANAQSGTDSYGGIVNLLISDYADRIDQSDLI